MYSLEVESDWDHKTGNGIRLLPDFKPVTVTVSTAYDGQGRCDYGKMISDIERPMIDAWKVEIDLRRQAKVSGGIEEFLKEIMLEDNVWGLSDVLGEFSLASAGAGGDAAGFSLPLQMKDSGYRFDLDCTPAADGKPDALSIVETLANAFCHVFRLAAGKEVFSPAQLSDLLARASAWAEGLMQEAGVVIPRAEVDLQSAQWVESSLGLWVKVYSDREDKYALLVPVGKQGKPDFAGVDRVAARIARDWGQRVGLAGIDWLCAKISAEIESDAREYVNWILEEEAKLLLDFFDSLNRELAGHLKTAEDLHGRAVKWRADFEAWAKGRGNFKPEASWEASAGAGAKVAAQVPEMPAELKSTFTKIWEGLCKLPGAVYKGVKPKTGEIAKGLEFGFRAAGIVIRETAFLVAEDVYNAAMNGLFAYASVKTEKILAKTIGGRAAGCTVEVWDILSLLDDRKKVPDTVMENMNKLAALATDMGEEIAKIKGDIYE